MNLRDEEQPLYLRIFCRLFLRKNKEYKACRHSFENLKCETPRKLVIRNFITNKAALAGLFFFVSLLLLVIIVPFFFPFQASYQEVTQQNVPPGRNLLSVPSKLIGDVRQISVGSTFSVGVSKEGKIYLWGKYPKSIQKIPTTLRLVKQVSAGLNHILALDTEGRLYAWGSNRFDQIQIPKEVIQRRDINQILAGNQCSMVVTDTGELYYFGNQNLMDFAVKEYQGKIKKVAANTSSVLGLLEDGSVVYLGKRQSVFVNIPDIASPVVDIAMTAKNAYALDETGNIYQWGEDGTQLIHLRKDHTERLVSMEAGRYHLIAIGEYGSVFAFGENVFGVTKIPNKLHEQKVAQVFTGYYQNYAITKDGSLYTWGLSGYLFGTDGYGRDIFTRMMNGGRLTMTIGAVAVVIQTILGVIIGGISGYFGGRVDNLCMRFTEVVNALPFLPFAMILSVLIGNRLSSLQRIYMIMVVLGILNWTGMARLVRAQVLAEKNKEYVTAAKAVGNRQWHIIWHHILPNVISFVIVSATSSFAASMLTESSLSFLGFGVIEPHPTWGNMLTGAQSSIIIRSYWWRWVFPAAALSIATIAINLVGDGLRDAVDPKGNW